jgi:putative membrane-bound dehydrogenase-like protein
MNLRYERIRNHLPRFLRYSAILAVVPFAASLATCSAPADDPAKAKMSPTTKAADDFGKQLPRVPANEPQAALAAFTMQPGFHVELVAAEPLVRDPVAVDFDENGRMYVVELPPYNLYALENSKERGSIRLLEDTNDDGRFDKSTVFAADLNYPTAVACWDGGLFVGDAPHLLFLKDTDGDGKADERKIVFSGFGTDKAGEAHLNSIRWGLDNRFHFSTSLSGGNVTAAADKAAKPVSVRGRGFVFDPRDLSKFELTSGGGQHGMSMDNWGRKYVCSNSVPAQTLMYDDRYAARNPHLQAPAAAVNIAPQGKFTKLFRISPPEPWRVLRTRLRRTGKFRGSDEGGKPFGFFTGATGITIYRGDAWPAAYRGNLLVGDVANNLVYRARLERNGLQVVARRADAGGEFLASRDIWFRPVQFVNAPDGTMYVLDMYRELIEGAAFLPPEFLKHLDPASGINHGRIYRIAPDRFRRRKTPRLGTLSTAELVALLDHPNGWHRDTASRLLYQRQDRTAIGLLKRVAANSELPEGRATAMHSLDGLNGLDEETLLKALGDPSDDVLVQAIRLSEKFAADSPAVRARLVALGAASSLPVRYQVAFSLGSFGGAARNAALAKLALRDVNDRWMQLAILSALNEGAADVFSRLLPETAFRKSQPGRTTLVALSRQIGAAGRNSEIAVVLNSLGALPASEKPLVETLVQALIEKQKGKSRERILAAAGGRGAEIVAAMLAAAQTKAVDEKANVTERAEAVRVLRLAKFAVARPLFVELLQLRQPQPVQAATLETIAEFNDPGVADVLLGAWSHLSPGLRTRAVETVLSRPKWVTEFLKAIEEGRVGRGDIEPSRVQLLKRHPDRTIAARVGKLFASNGLSARKEVVQRYQPALDMKGDIGRGKLVFKKNCSACHRLEDVGTAIGAELRGIRQRGLPSVLLNILDPNREVKPKFLTYVAVTNDGRVITGMITAESANGITIRRTDGTTANLQRVDIEELKSSGISFMPEGLEKQVNIQSMADLLSYLDSIK